MRTQRPLLVAWLFGLLTTFGTHALAKTPLPIATEDYPPYEMLEPVNGLKGFDFEVMHAVFELLGEPIDVEFLPWKRALAYTQLGQKLGILTCAYRPEREEYILFSDPISEFVNGFYTRLDHNGPEPTLLEDIKGQKVGSIEAYESFKALEAIGANPIPAPDTKSAILMLLKNRFDYLYVNKQSTDFMLKQLGHTHKVKFFPISRQDFYFCFSRKYPGYEQFASDFNKALYLIKRNGTYDRIHSKYQ